MALRATASTGPERSSGPTEGAVSGTPKSDNCSGRCGAASTGPTSRDAISVESGRLPNVVGLHNGCTTKSGAGFVRHRPMRRIPGGRKSRIQSRLRTAKVLFSGVPSALQTVHEWARATTDGPRSCADRPVPMRLTPSDLPEEAKWGFGPRSSTSRVPELPCPRGRLSSPRA